MRTLALLALLFFLKYSVVFAQSGEPEYMPVKWKVGTERTFTTIDSSYIYSDNELLSSTFSKATYSFKILSLKDTIYEVRYKHIYLSSEFDFTGGFEALGEFAKPFENMLANFQKSISSFEFIVLVDKNSGTAFQVKNEAQYLIMFEKLVNSFVEEFVKAIGEKRTNEEKNKFRAKIIEELKLKSDAILETTLNSLNYLLQFYTYPYIIDGVYTSEMEMQEIDQIQNEGVTYKANIETRATKESNLLKLKSIYHFDKPELYAILKKNSDSPEEFVSIQEFAVFQETTIIFDLRTSWITSYSSVYDVILGAVQVKEVSYLRVD